MNENLKKAKAKRLVTKVCKVWGQKLCKLPENEK
jgi:hypothetical protein